MINKTDLFPIGIGTWGIGGFVERDPQNNDEKQIKALEFMLSSGMNYIELNVWTSQGRSVELVSDALNRSRIDRRKIFLSQAIYSYTSSSIAEARNELTKLCKLFDTDYIDSISLNEAAIFAIRKDTVIQWYREILKSKKVRYINLNNPSIETLKEFHRLFKDRLFSIEIGFNFEVKEYLDDGIINFAKKNKILCVVYQPLRRNRTANRNWPLLVELSKKYNKTQNQILLNWISSKGTLPLTKSESIEHIKEHLESLKFKIRESDIKRLDEFRPPNYNQPKVYWGLSGEGIRVDQLSNVFDEEYDKQQKS